MFLKLLGTVKRSCSLDFSSLVGTYVCIMYEIYGGVILYCNKRQRSYILTLLLLVTSAVQLA